MSEIIEKIQKASIRTLNGMVQESLSSVERQIVDQIGEFLALSEKRDDVLMSFVTHMNNHFDELQDKEIVKEEAVFDFETLSLVQEEELDVMVALEGMVSASRNEHLPNFISFNTRLNSIFPRKRIDETTNPLDPEQIANAFQEALRPINMDSQNLLAVYRAFNNCVLKRLDEILQEANKILIDNGVIPNLGMESAKKREQAVVRASRRREQLSAFGTVEEEEYEESDERPEMFSMMQNLLHGDSPTANLAAGAIPESTSLTRTPGGGVEIPEGHVVVPADQVQQFMVPTAMIPGAAKSDGSIQPGVMQPFQPAENQEVQMVDQAKLMEILGDIQKSLDLKPTPSADGVPTDIDEVSRVNISESLGEMLTKVQEDETVVNAIDRESSDVINLVTLLYEAIWDDDSVPIPIKELIGRTQITIIKVALSDNTFFNRENHPARAILNEFASAGIGWTEVEKLEEDPLYKKIQELVEKIQAEFKEDISFFEDLIKDFRTFKAREAAKTRHLEQSILKANERKERLDDIHELVSQKIEERILGRDVDVFIRDILENPFHKFMVMLVLKEGPGSNAWKQAINTIDVLLWSIQPHEQSGDRGRLETVNPRLLNNLRKAFRIASVDADTVNALISGIKEVQESSFDATEDTSETLSTEDAISPVGEPDQTNDSSVEASASDENVIEKTEQSAEDDRDHLTQVEAMTVGIWVEFVGEDEQNTRCKLAAKINAIDKFIFVNRQGVKVVEKTTIGLAKELKEGTVRIISDGLLFSRALESVIGNLRDRQHEQHTGGAYQPST